jgi:phage shock protein E
MLDLIKSIFGASVDIREVLDRGAIVIDVRNPGEFQQGHPDGAINIPLDQIERQVNKIKAYNKPVITCCVSGMRSGSAASILKSNDIEAYNGGAWQNVQSKL